MKRTLSLRIASVLSLLFAAGHTLGGTKSWSPIADNDVFRSMRSFRFDVEGTSRTYADFYVGLGYSLSVFLFLQAIVLWQLALLAKKESVGLRPLIGSFFAASLLLALVKLANTYFCLPSSFQPRSPCFSASRSFARETPVRSFERRPTVTTITDDD